MDAGQLLREIRLARGLGQADLARRAGTTQTYISRIERGAVSPSLNTLERLLSAMGQRLQLSTDPLAPGNVSERDLRADVTNLTAAERLEQAMQLSAFLTDVAAAAPPPPTSTHGST